MNRFRVGYFVGSLATASINRLLAKALVRLAPPGLDMTEIPFKDLPRIATTWLGRARLRLPTAPTRERPSWR